MIRKIVITCLCAMMHSPTPPALSNSNLPTVNIEESFYQVSGKSVEEIRRSLNNNSPVRVNGRNYDAYTGWYIIWNYSYKLVQNSCTITDATSTISIQHTMPRLISNVSAKLERKWQNYFDALRRHESGHRDIGIRAATEVKRAIAAMAPQPDCSTIEKMANDLGNAIIKKYIVAEKKYDSDTYYGAGEGAKFP